MLRIKKEQKERLAASRSGGAVAPCPKYDGYFEVVEAGTEEPAKGVPYRIRRPDGAVIEGITDARGFTQPIPTKRPEILALDLLDVAPMGPIKSDEGP